MDRRSFLVAGASTAVLSASAGGCADAASVCGVPLQPAPSPAAPHVDLEEATLSDLAARMQRGEVSAADLTERYLARIEAIDRHGPALHAVIEVNPDALALARGLDAERRAGRVRGPLHGVPILVKDNLDTGDRMETTAGSLALAGTRAHADAHVVRRLREAGAVILGKTNLSEWANIRSTHSTSGWSGRGGLTEEPVRPRPQHQRIQLRLRRGRRGQPVRGGDRHRDRRVHREPGVHLRHRRAQADRRAGEPRRHRPHLP